MPIHIIRIVKEGGDTAPLERDRIRTLADGRMKPEEAARYLDKEVKTLANWRHEGLGPKYMKFCRHIYYRQEWLDEFIRTGHPTLTLAPVRSRAKPTRKVPARTEPTAPPRVANIFKITASRKPGANEGSQADQGNKP
jgi:hypothetical protein